jgi:hypothetical protein
VSDRLRRFWPDLALLGAVLTAAAALTRLIGGGPGGVALGPLLLSAAVGVLLPAGLAWRGVAAPIRVLGGTVGVALVSLWTSSPGSTTYGLPTGHTWHVLEANLRTARPVLVGFSVPLRPTQGIVVLASLVVGTVAVVASTLLRLDERADHPSPVLALACPCALLVLVAVQSARPSIALPIGLFVVCGAVAITMSQPAPVGTPSGRRHRWWFSTTTTLTLAGALGASVVALGVDGGGGGAAGSSPGGGVVAAVPPTGLALASNLVALEVHDANVVLFSARSAVPTYWQVAVLNVLRNGQWTMDPDASPAAAGTGAGDDGQTQPIGAVGSGAGAGATFTATVRVGPASRGTGGAVDAGHRAG